VILSNEKPKWRKPQKTNEAKEVFGKFAIFYGVEQTEQMITERNTAFAKTRNGDLIG